jgi:hypothetical protein
LRSGRVKRLRSHPWSWRKPITLIVESGWHPSH